MARILVIDDEADIRGLLREVLEGVGHQVIEAADGRLGRDLYRLAPTDVVISDIVMPSQEGIETIMQLRAEFPSLRVIAISGGGALHTPAYLEAASLSGADRTFAKPFDPQEVLRAVHDLLGR